MKLIAEKPTRGFHEEKCLLRGLTKGKIRYVRNGYHLEPCPGEAHLPEVGGMIDNCGLCTPLWGQRAVKDKGAES